MTASLTSVREQVAQVLQDPAYLVFDSATLDGSIRLGLADYSRMRGSLQTLSGLDGAGATSFPDLDAEVIAIGAAAYAVLGRVVRRGEGFQFDQAVPAEARAWGEARLADFRAMLDQLRRGLLRSATVIPWAAAGWSMDAWDPNTGEGSGT
jgi:hypothetical protein